MQGNIVSGQRSLDMQTFHKRSAQAAYGLSSMGIGDGDSIALMLRNDFPFLEVTFAASQIGAYSVPINWHYKEKETAYILENSDAKILVVHSDLVPDLPSTITNTLKILAVTTPKEIIAAYSITNTDFTMPSQIIEWEKWRDEQLESEAPPLANRGSMIYTSGTTGNPKGVRRFPASNQLQSAMMERLKLGFALQPGAKALMTGPMYHSAPNAYARAIVSLGGSLILMPKFDAQQCLQMIEHYSITHMHVVPTMFIRLLQLSEREKNKYNLSSLQSVVHGAAPCPPEVKSEMIEWWGPIIHEYYGSTEAGLITVVNSKEWLKEKGTVGKPLPETEVHILNDEKNNLRAGAIGDIYVNLPTSPGFTYYKDSNKRKEIEVRGLITNGDRGHLTESGYLYLADRRANMVISGGVNIYPAEIESVLITMPGVQDCAVFGIPDAVFGEKLAAAVQVAEGAHLEESDIKNFIANHLARFKIPKLIKFFSTLPREDSGKIFKRILRDNFLNH